MIEVVVDGQPPPGIDPPSLLIRAAEALGCTTGELSVAFVDDPTMQALNARWRGVDLPTDVLSFPQGGDLLGDIVVSVDTGARQAGQLGHSLVHEVAVLLVHGLCHLLGHDHADELQAARMAEAEGRALAAAGFGGESLVGRALA